MRVKTLLRIYRKTKFMLFNPIEYNSDDKHYSFRFSVKYRSIYYDVIMNNLKNCLYYYNDLYIPD